MPREFRMIAPRAADLEAIVAAAATVDESLAVRAVAYGQVIQLVDAADTTILSIQSSRLLDHTDDLARIAPDLAGLPAASPPSYWTEGFAPWNPGGELGARVMVALARTVGGTLLRSDA